MPWSPSNQYLWDFWFAWRERELHAFYLQADKVACGYQPEARHQLAAIGHAVLTRWGWQQVSEKPVLAAGAVGAWDDLAIWTGSIIENFETTTGHAQYFLFYTARAKAAAPHWTPSEWQRPQQIGVAVSTDLRHWQRTAATLQGPVIPNPGREFGLDGVAWRDPFVFRDAEDRYYALICARRDPEAGLAAPEAGGVIVFVESADLYTWTPTPQFIQCPDEFYQMEVPQFFWRRTAEGKRGYLLFSAQAKDCARVRRASGQCCQTGTYYLKSAELPVDFVGLPRFTESAQLLAPGLYAGKLLLPAETPGAAVFFGFEWADAAGHFVGGISDPWQAHFAEDGSITLTSTGLETAWPN